MESNRIGLNNYCAYCFTPADAHQERCSCCSSQIRTSSSSYGDAKRHWQSISSPRSACAIPSRTAALNRADVLTKSGSSPDSRNPPTLHEAKVEGGAPWI
jgi:hypothetical protein